MWAQYVVALMVMDTERLGLGLGIEGPEVLSGNCRVSCLFVLLLWIWLFLWLSTIIFFSSVCKYHGGQQEIARSVQDALDIF